MKLESQFYQSLDLARAAKEQYGSSASITSVGDHLYDWRAKVGSDLKALDLKRAVASQYGQDWSLVTVGVHKYDWKALRFAEPSRIALPVMLIASDQFFNIDGVRWGLDNFKSAVGRVQDWYNQYLNGKLRMMQPLVLKTSYTSAQWNDLSKVTNKEGHRYDLMNAELEAYKKYLPTPGEYLRIALAPYTGDNPNVNLGAACSGKFACVAPRSTSVYCAPTGDLTENAQNSTYAIGHELGHSFGLHHTCDTYPNEPNCWNSIMQQGVPPTAILLPQEVDYLLSNPFFNPTADPASVPSIPPYKLEQMGELAI